MLKAKGTPKIATRGGDIVEEIQKWKNMKLASVLSLLRFSISEEITHGITPKGELQLKILLKHDSFSFAFLSVVKADVRSRMETSDVFSEARQSLQNETC